MKKPPSMLVGCFFLGHQQVELIADLNDDGGCFYFSPADGKLPRIRIGIKYREWESVVAVLLHEAIEFALTQANHRYAHTGKVGGDHADYTFVFNHPEFSRVATAIAPFIMDALPKIAVLYKKHRKK